MPGTDYDVIVGGYKLKVARREEGGYRRTFERREIQQQLISQSETPAIQSRSDRAALYQSSWSGGATWWKPLVTPSQVNTYFRAGFIDAWSEPGILRAVNSVAEETSTTKYLDGAKMAFDDLGDIYMVGDTENVSAGSKDVYKWDPTTETFVQETGYHAGAILNSKYHSLIFDSSDGYFYVADSSSGQINRFNPSTSAQDNNYVDTTVQTRSGAAILQVPNGGLMFYDGEKVWDINKSGPSITEVFDDGLGPDMSFGGFSPGSPNAYDWLMTEKAVATPEGIYYIKNVFQAGRPVCHVFRVERNAAGSWLGYPIATLPPGEYGMDIVNHLGSLVISAANDLEELSQGGGHVPVTLYGVSQSGLNVIGKPLGDAVTPDETPYRFLTAEGSLLFFGGHKRLWVYDGARGGVHVVFEWPTTSTYLGVLSMAAHEQVNGDKVNIVFMQNSITTHAVLHWETRLFNSPNEVNALDDVDNTNNLESNYFDFGMPMEEKELTKVEVLHDAIDSQGRQRWTVQIAADDGAWTTVLESDTANSTYGSADLSGTTGRRFRYRLIYKTTTVDRVALRALKISATSGEQVQQWDLLIDGSEILNVDNEVQDEQTFYDNMVTLGQTNTTTTIIDNMQEQEQEQDDSGAGIRIKVMQVRIVKEKPGESLLQLVLRED